MIDSESCSGSVTLASFAVSDCSLDFLAKKSNEQSETAKDAKVTEPEQDSESIKEENEISDKDTEIDNSGSDDNSETNEDEVKE